MRSVALTLGTTVLLLLSTAVLSTPPAAAAPYLPSGFALRDMPSGQTELLTDFAFAPDGSYFTVGKNGRVAWVSTDGRATTLAELAVVAVQDLGLSGLAVAHDYATSRTIYLARTLSVNGKWTMRLSAWRVVYSTAAVPEPVSITGERILWDLPADADGHATTGLVSAPDGTLWVSIGDAADFRFVDHLALRALDINVGYGKVLHILPDGRGVPSNPYFDPAAPSSWKSRVYASGFRSPFRMTLDPTTGTPILGDVGWQTWEEVNLIRPGASYGWPCWEGGVQTPGYRDLAACKGVVNTPPLWNYVHGPLGTSVTGGIVYTGSSYPTEYQGAYFFGDYASQRVYTLRYDSRGALVRQPEAGGFGVENGAPVKFAAAPNGDIAYADIGGSRIRRLVYLPGNRAPSAEAVLSNVAGQPRTLAFDASGSSDLDGEPLTYSWDFGDGTRGSGVRTTHTYGAPGTSPLTARLTVTDLRGAQATTSFTVVPANGVPVVAMTTPPASRDYAVGERVDLAATATDPEDGPLPVTWRVTLVHCSGGYCHDHPGESFVGPAYSRPFVDHGDETRLEITATGIDTHGVRSESTFVARPRLRTLTVGASTPSAITVNGVPRAATKVAAGARVTVVAPTVASDNVATFERWTDGQPRERTLVMPDADTALTATYLTPIDRRYAAEATIRSVLGTPTGPEVGDARLRYRTYAAGRMYWTASAGAHEVHGSILAVYLAGGGHLFFGEPLTDELPTADGVGRYNAFAAQQSHIYWSPATGAQPVYGDIGVLFRSLGADRGIHRYPRTGELPTPDGRGRYNDFQNGSIYWLPGVGARSVHGSIHATWGRFGYSAGILRFPLTNESVTPDGVGRYNHFEGGSVYWTPRTGAHEVHGSILARWRALGWERSYLGYPTSDEYAVPGGRRSNFERGYITWDARTGQVTDRRY